ncbi:MAG TPA: HAD-IA family hydrolase [Afifellaceae bacterium]|nr:HAD-IA family hydrolase [Afifellaceae bacterium]
MTEIQHIVFDIGRVLLHWDPELPYLDLIPDAERRRWFLETVCSPAWNAEQDRGRGWAEAEALLIEEFPEEQDLIRAYRGRWHEMVPHAYDDVVDVLNRLIDDGHDVTMLTNFNDLTFAEVRARFPFLDRPRGVTVSGEVRLLKPEPEIYSRHAESFALNPSAILFTDDSPANVAAAEAAGWNAVLFRDAERLKADLQEHGIAI